MTAVNYDELRVAIFKDLINYHVGRLRSTARRGSQSEISKVVES